MSSDEDEPQQFEIDYIYKDKLFNRVQHFFVHWKGYEDKDNSWVSIADMACEDLMNEYLERKDAEADEKRRLQRERKRLESISSPSKNRDSADQPGSSKQNSRASLPPKESKKIKIHYAGRPASDSESREVQVKSEEDSPQKQKKTPAKENKQRRIAKIESDSEPDEPVLQKPESSKKKKKASSEDKEKATGSGKKEVTSPVKKSGEKKSENEDSEKQKKKRKRKNRVIESDNSDNESTDSRQPAQATPLTDRASPLHRVPFPPTKPHEKEPVPESQEEERVPVSPPKDATDPNLQQEFVTPEKSDNLDESNQSSQSSSCSFITAPQASQGTTDSTITAPPESDELYDSESIRRRNEQKAAFEAAVAAREESKSRSRTETPANDENRTPDRESSASYGALAVDEEEDRFNDIDRNMGEDMGALRNEDFSLLRPTPVPSALLSEAMDSPYSPLLEEPLRPEQASQPDSDDEDDDDLIAVEEIQIPVAKNLNGFERGWKPERILFFIVEPGVKIEDIPTTASERAFGAVKFWGQNEIQPLPYKEIKQRNPKLLNEYFIRINQIQAAKGMDVTGPSQLIPCQAEDLDIDII